MAGAAGAAGWWRFGDPLALLAAILDGGGLAAIPTESSYGLAAVPTDAAAVAAVYRLKRRERGKPLPVVIAGREQLAGLGIAPDLPILVRLSALWPGPLTVVVPLAEGVAAPAAAAGAGSLAVRVPGHPQLRDLLARLGHGLTATSLNESGAAPILDPLAAAALLAGLPAMVVDGGRLAGGAPSTLVEVVGGAAGEAVRVLRPGRLAVEALRAVVRVVS